MAAAPDLFTAARGRAAQRRRVGRLPSDARHVAAAIRCSFRIYGDPRRGASALASEYGEGSRVTGP